jgi:hypothetical protein
MRLATLFALSAVSIASPLAAQARTAPDSQRAGRSLRALQLIQGFQMTSTPELASAINALLSDDATHMRMAPRRAATAADSARAAAVVKSARHALAKYSDVSLAERDGYVKFLPWLEDQSIYHYNNVFNVMSTLGAFDPTKPVSLLYKKDDKGAMRLVGAMYSAPPNATPDDLDARLPTGIAHWHEHVDFCGPNPDSVRAGVQKVDAPSTAKWLAISTPEACAAAGGRFVPRLFGWMAHVYLFSGDDPTVIWGDEHASMDTRMDMPMHHPPARH